MIQTFTISPKKNLKTKAPSEERFLITLEDSQVNYTIAFVGPYCYSWETKVDNDMHVWNKDRGVPHNFHIGNGNSIGVNLRCVFGRNHNTKIVSSGALETHMIYSGIQKIGGGGKATSIKRGA